MSPIAEQRSHVLNECGHKLQITVTRCKGTCSLKIHWWGSITNGTIILHHVNDQYIFYPPLKLSRCCSLGDVHEMMRLFQPLVMFAEQAYLRHLKHTRIFVCRDPGFGCLLGGTQGVGFRRQSQIMGPRERNSWLQRQWPASDTALPPVFNSPKDSG